MKSGDKQTPNGKKKTGCLPILVVVLVLAAIGSTLGNSGGEQAAASSVPVSSAAVSSAEDASDPAETVPSSEAEAPVDDSVPTEYRSALASAESYSELMHMSKAGIYDQLVSEYGEQFSPEAA